MVADQGWRATGGDTGDVDAAEPHWKDQRVTVIRDAFERSAQRLLCEVGFLRVEVTDRSGDGGIAGVGVLRVNLLSFPALFQCKRYQGSVTREGWAQVQFAIFVVPLSGAATRV